jgi:hypothetical protein
MSAAEAILWCERLAAVATLIASAETVARPRGLDDNSLRSWRVHRERLPVFTSRAAPLFDLPLAYPNVIVLHAARVLCAGALLAVGDVAPVAAGLLALVLVATQVGLFLRCPFGWDGADQLAVAVLTATAAARLVGTHDMQVIALAFITADALLAYLSAGVWKAVSPIWRREPALVSILSTRAYGNSWLAAVLGRSRAVGVATSRMVFVWEIAFVTVLLLPPTWVWVALATGAAFHLANGVLMGLNTFLWAFVATYPAIAWCANAV